MEKFENKTKKGVRWHGAYLNPGERAVLKERDYVDFEERFWKTKKKKTREEV